MKPVPGLCVDGKFVQIEYEKGQFLPEQGKSQKKVCQFVIQIMRDGGVFCAVLQLGPTLTACRGVTKRGSDLEFVQKLGLGPCYSLVLILWSAAKAAGRGSVSPEGTISRCLLHCRQTPDLMCNSRIEEEAPGHYLSENVNNIVVK